MTNTLLSKFDDEMSKPHTDTEDRIHKPTQPRMPPISIGGGIGEQRGKNKRIVFTLN